MRTTVDMDENVLAAARAIAAAERRSLGAVLSDLARRSLEPVPEVDEDGMPVFEVPADVAPLTPDMVKLALDE